LWESVDVSGILGIAIIVGAVGAGAAGVGNPWNGLSAAAARQAVGVGLIGRDALRIACGNIAAGVVKNAGLCTAKIGGDADVARAAIAVNGASGRRGLELGAGTGSSERGVGDAGEAGLADQTARPGGIGGLLAKHANEVGVAGAAHIDAEQPNAGLGAKQLGGIVRHADRVRRARLAVRAVATG